MQRAKCGMVYRKYKCRAEMKLCVQCGMYSVQYIAYINTKQKAYSTRVDTENTESTSVEQNESGKY